MPDTKKKWAHHGLRETPEYRHWLCMRMRCNHKPRYRDAGIKVCARWDSFVLFLEDVGERPSAEHTLDRIDNAKGYEPGNVRWATRSEQQNNRRDNIMVEFEGVQVTVGTLAKRLGIARETLITRRENGIPMDAPPMSRSERARRGNAARWG
jgi:hypothetical protein